jgi:hypothetical protein
MTGASDFSDPGVHTASYSRGTRSSFSGATRLGRGTDHSLPSSAEVKNGGVMRPLPHTSSWLST